MACGNWFVLNNEFSWQFNGLSVQWIYLAPGKKTQEGEILWKELGINPRIEGSLTKYRNAEDLYSEVLEKALPLMQGEVTQRTTKSEIQKLTDEIDAKLGSLRGKASSLGVSWLRGNPHSVVSRFRHMLTSYDKKTKKGEGRLTATLQAHNDFMEILNIFRDYKEQILSIENPPPYMEWYINLAKIDHGVFIDAAIDQINHRR